MTYDAIGMTGERVFDVVPREDVERWKELESLVMEYLADPNTGMISVREAYRVRMRAVIGA